jgi:TusA-related sulfurtransferase
LDLRGKECPFTVLELGKTVRGLARGDVLEIRVGRETAVDDIRAWCEGTGNEFLTSEVTATIKVYLRKV